MIKTLFADVYDDSVTMVTYLGCIRGEVTSFPPVTLIDIEGIVGPAWTDREGQLPPEKVWDISFNYTECVNQCVTAKKLYMIVVITSCSLLYIEKCTHEL